MKPSLNFHIDRFVGFPRPSLSIATFGLFVIGAGFGTLVTARRRINGTLNKGSRRLGLYMGHSLRHNIWLYSVRKNGGGNGRDLHKAPLFLTSVSHQSGKEGFKHLVANFGVEKARNNNELGLNASCGIVQL